MPSASKPTTRALFINRNIKENLSTLSDQLGRGSLEANHDRRRGMVTQLFFHSLYGGMTRPISVLVFAIGFDQNRLNLFKSAIASSPTSVSSAR